MTAYPFTPPLTAPFTFTPTLDGAQYLATVVWNVFAQRYYLTLSDFNGAVMFTRPVSGSPAGQSIAALSWSETAQQVTLTTSSPHGYPVGTTLPLSIAACSPAAYNGTFPCLVTGAETLTYPLAVAPGTASSLGAVGLAVNLVFGYFSTSTLVFQPDNGLFLVTP